MKRITLLSMVLLLFGCKPKTVTSFAAPAAGPNIELQYPVLILSKQTRTIETRSDARDLTTTTVLHNDIFEGMQVVDSSSNLYSVESQRPAEKVPGWPGNASGNAHYRIEMKLKFQRKLTLDETKRILLEIVKDPKSYWSESHYGASAAVKVVTGAKDLAHLITECSESSKWL